MNSSLKKNHVICIAILISLIGIIIDSTPFGTNLEIEYTQNWFFQWRGKTVPSKEIIIVSIDKVSADVLSLTNDPEEWPRKIYAHSIKNIKAQKPAIIAFNIAFVKNRGSENDKVLASAMEQAGNVVLSSYLRTITASSQNKHHTANKFRHSPNIVSIIDPTNSLGQAAIGVSPFLLPNIDSTVEQFWTYRASAGDVQTLPTTVFQCYIFKRLYPEIVDLLQIIEPSLAMQLPDNRCKVKKNSKTLSSDEKINLILKNKPLLLKRLSDLVAKTDFSLDKSQLLKSWFSFLEGNDNVYFNHYGATGAFPSIPLYQTLNPALIPANFFKNKIVLIGHSEDIRPENYRGYFTLFSKQKGESISSTEILATAISNLIDNTWLKPLMQWEHLLILILWGSIITFLFGTFSYGYAVLIILILSGYYSYFAYSNFVENQILLPLFIPLIIQLPLSFIIASLLTYIQNIKQQQKIHSLFSSYIPNEFVNKISAQPNPNNLIAYGELKQGVCLATDLGGYTTLSETLSPVELNNLMNNYYGLMFPIVQQSQGIVSDVIGDAMLAIWSESPLSTLASIQKNACVAALQIKNAVDNFNKTQSNDLPTRFGLHFGDMYLGNVGTQEHFEYRATGDIINTTTRIQDLNKTLGTSILVTLEVIENTSEFFTREIGTFILKGKTRPIIIYELLGYPNTIDSYWVSLEIIFQQALEQFKRLQWAEALTLFLKIQGQYPKDKPTLFYINYIKQHLHLLNTEQHGQQSAVIKFEDFPTKL